MPTMHYYRNIQGPASQAQRVKVGKDLTNCLVCLVVQQAVRHDRPRACEIGICLSSSSMAEEKKMIGLSSSY